MSAPDRNGSRLEERAPPQGVEERFQWLVEVLGRLQLLTGALSAARTPEQVANVVVHEGAEALGAATAAFVRPNDGELELVASHGIPERVVDLWRRFAADERTLVGVAFRSRTAQWVEELADFAARYPGVQFRPRPSSAAAIPLVVADRVLGVAAFQFEGERRFASEEQAVLQTMGTQAAQALDCAEAYASAQEARRSADVANRAKDEFLAVVSHELRTPLTAILGWAKIMSSPRFDDHRRPHALQTIERSAVLMAQLIEDLLDMSRIMSGKMRLDVQQVELARVIEAAIDSIRPAADAKGIRIDVTVDVLPPIVLGDPARLQQIVWNLLSNAVKFTPRSGRVDVLLRRHDSSAEISVSDSGQGIAPHFLSHVFDPFRQEDAGHTRSRGGLGLGLAITRHLVELHGGRIEANSSGPGKGATFSVRLPIAAAAGRSPDERERRAPGSLSTDSADRPPQLRGLRVLVVDDEEDARQLIRVILEDCGCRVTLAGRVDEAMSAIAAGVPDVLISDIGMPERDGYDLIREVRRLSPAQGGDMPAAALTAYARSEDRRSLLNAGYSTHITKPVDPGELVAIVASLVRFTLRRGPRDAG